MKKLLMTLAAGALAATTAMADGKDPVVTIVTSDNPQTQLMAMVLTMQAVQAGHPVQMLLCGAAGDIALKDAPEMVTAPQPPKGMSPQVLMGKIMDAGAKVEVCALYLPAKGADASILLDGITAAKPKPMGAAMLADDARVWSF